MFYTEKQTLISKAESEDSKVTQDEADKFVEGEVKVDQTPVADKDETTDDLLMDL